MCRECRRLRAELEKAILDRNHARQWFNFVTAVVSRIEPEARDRAYAEVRAMPGMTEDPTMELEGTDGWKPGMPA